MLAYEDLVAWAGDGNVTRADAAAVAGWRIPEGQKAVLVDVGVPLVDRLVERVAYQTDPEPLLETASGKRLYQLTHERHGDEVYGLRWAFGVEPETGKVYHVLPNGESWFTNSSIDRWLLTLHHYSLHVGRSPVLTDPGER